MIIFLFCLSAVCQADPVIIDGTTSTSVHIDPSGQVSIIPAAKNPEGLSHNSYEQFNVPQAGMTFDNTSTQAKVIVNEVTSHHPSKIEGKVSLDGTQADIIVANPNGIEVNGGEFIGWRNVSLGTGSLTTQVSAPLLDVIGGQIHIHGTGLKSDGERLDVISKTILIDGNVDTGSGWLNLVTGKSVHAISATSGLFYHATTGMSSDTEAITISDGAVLKGGRINMLVTDQGAGVHLAGGLNAEAGGLRVQSSGEITLGHTSAASDGRMEIIGTAITQQIDKRITLTSHTSGVRLKATTTDISLSDITITAKTRDTSSFAPLGAISLEASRHILVTPPENTTNIWSATEDAIGLTAGENIDLTKTSLTSQNRVNRINSGRSLFLDQVMWDTNGRLSFLNTNSFSVQSTNLNATGGISVEASQIDIFSKIGHISSLISNDADISLRARAGDIILSSTQIEGNAASTGDDPDISGVKIVSALGQIVHRSIEGMDLASMFSRIGGIYINAKTGIQNLSATITSNDDIIIKTEGDILNQSLLSSGNNSSLTKQSKGHWWNAHTVMSNHYGTPLLNNQRSEINAGTTLTLDAQNIDNQAGVIIGRNINANATQNLNSQSLVTGSFWYKRKCRIFCRATGAGNIGLLEAQIFANETLNVTAGQRVNSTGAVFLSGLNQSITSPVVGFNSLLYPQLMLRPAGFSGLFGGNEGWVGLAYTGGYVGSSLGDIFIQSDHISFSGINPQIGGLRNFSSPPHMQSTPSASGILDYHKIGLFQR